MRAGGGLWVALGDQIDHDEFNRDWYSDGDGLSPLELDSLEVIDKADDVAATVHPPSRDHPATLQLANTTQLDIDEARIRAAMDVCRAVGRTGEPCRRCWNRATASRWWWRSTWARAACWCRRFRSGLEWSNLPLLKAYVVMVHDWLAYVTAPTMARYNLRRVRRSLRSAPKDAAGAYGDA